MRIVLVRIPHVLWNRTLLSGRRGRPWFTTVANCCWQQMDVTVTRPQALGGALRAQMLCLQSGSCTDVGSKSPGRPLIPFDEEVCQHASLQEAMCTKGFSILVQCHVDSPSLFQL